MNARHAVLRLLARGLGIFLAVVLAIGALVSGVHHHADSHAHSPCAVCTAGHSLAVAPDAEPTCGQPGLAPERVAIQHDRVERFDPLRRPSSRAPPLI